MKVIIPMAGLGQRFVDAGYKSPKPLIKVGGRYIVDYILDMFDRKNDSFFFICNEQHIESFYMKEILRGLVDRCIVVGIDPHTKGPVYSVVKSGALEWWISYHEPVIISYCDNPFLLNKTDFDAHLKKEDPDGCIFSHVGFHPHRLSSTYMAYMRTQEDPADVPFAPKTVLEVQEKKPFTENHWDEHASTGTYYFKRAKYVQNYFSQMINQDVNHNGEYYVTLVYNLMMADGLKVTALPSSMVAVFGTPEEVENFEAWKTILKGSQIKYEEDLKKVYRYWHHYHYLSSKQISNE